MYIEGNSAIVKDRLTKKGVEIIDEKITEPINCSSPDVEASAHTPDCSSNTCKRCKLSSWLREAAEAQAPYNNSQTPEQRVKKD